MFIKVIKNDFQESFQLFTFLPTIHLVQPMENVVRYLYFLINHISLILLLLILIVVFSHFQIL